MFYVMILKMYFFLWFVQCQILEMKIIKKNIIWNKCTHVMWKGFQKSKTFYDNFDRKRLDATQANPVSYYFLLFNFLISYLRWAQALLFNKHGRQIIHFSK